MYPLERSFFLVLILLGLSFVGCSSRGRVAYESQPAELEAFGYGQQLANELSVATNDFLIPYPDAAYAFERGRLFFNRFGGGVALSMRGKNESVLGARKSLPGYRYSLTRRDTPTGAQFLVRCERFVPDSKAFEPDSLGVRCKNFARFVKTGIIEDKLVTAQLPEP